MMAALLALPLALCLQTAQAQSAPTGPSPAAPAAIEAAYQREFAYLVAEKRALEERQRALAEEQRAELRRAEAELDGLAARLLAKERSADAVEARLGDVDEAAVAADQRGELVSATVSQAHEALGVEVAADQGRAAQLAAVFGAAEATVRGASAVTVRPGAFFSPTGAAVEGQLVQVGHIAVYGISPTASGALLPIGDGRLMLRATGGGEAAAQALAAGERPDQLDAFVIESTAKPLSERAEATFEETMQAGGTVGWIIVLLGVAALILAAVRALLLANAGRGTDLLGELGALLQRGDLPGAVARAAAARSATGRVAQALLGSAGLDREALQDVAAEALLREQATLDRFGALIFVVAAVAPLLGLLGTVTGMISTFEIITEFGTGDPKMLSSGISEALITTELGLIVAIPAVVLGNVLKGRASSVADALETGALHIINVLHAPTTHAPTDGAQPSGPQPSGAHPASLGAGPNPLSAASPAPAALELGAAAR
jgi:biopolymer transport protein ExbB